MQEMHGMNGDDANQVRSWGRLHETENQKAHLYIFMQFVVGWEWVMLQACQHHEMIAIALQQSHSRINCRLL